MVVWIGSTKKTINTLLVNFTLAKFASAFLTIIMVALIKYMVSGNFYIEYCEFWNNVVIGLLGWTTNLSLIDWFSEYLGLKGINFNLNQFLYGYDTMGAGNSSTVKDIKAKLYNAMESEQGSEPNKHIDKGKGIEKGSNEGKDESETKPLDKGKDIDKSSDEIIELKKNVEYFQLQTCYYINVLNTFNKPQHLWTSDEWALVAEQVRYKEYNRSNIEQCLKENSRNLSSSIQELKAKDSSYTDTSTLGKHYSASLTESDRKRAFKDD
jgi:hypothetical protein